MITLLRTFSVLVLTLEILSCTKASAPEVARVGDISITQKMIDLRDQVARTYYPGSPAGIGLKQLVEAYTLAEIMKKYGHAITDAEIVAEKDRIDKNTKDPATLAKIKALFSSDSDLYLKVFVLPNIAQTKMDWEFFPKYSPIQVSEKAAATDFVRQLVENPKDFEKLVAAHNQKQKTELFWIEVSPGKEVHWTPWSLHLHPPAKDSPFARDREEGQLVDESVHQLPNAELGQKLKAEFMAKKEDHPETERWIKDIIMPNAEGAVFDKLIEQPEMWAIVQIVSKKPGKPFTLRAAGIRRPDLFAWIEEEKKNIPYKGKNP